MFNIEHTALECQNFTQQKLQKFKLTEAINK
jgi:hypothetical protein